MESSIFHRFSLFWFHWYCSRELLVSHRLPSSLSSSSPLPSSLVLPCVAIGDGPNDYCWSVHLLLPLLRIRSTLACAKQWLPATLMLDTKVKRWNYKKQTNVCLPHRLNGHVHRFVLDMCLVNCTVSRITAAVATPAHGVQCNRKKCEEAKSCLVKKWIACTYDVMLTVSLMFNKA